MLTWSSAAWLRRLEVRLAARPVLRILLLALALLACPTALVALDLEHDVVGATDPPGLERAPGLVIAGYVREPSGSGRMPTGRWMGCLGERSWCNAEAITGQRTRILYLAAPDMTSSAIMDHYRSQLGALGYTRLYDCSGFSECGRDIGDFYREPDYGKQFGSSFLLESAFASNSLEDPRLYVARRSADGRDSYLFLFAAYQDNYADSQAGQRVAVFLEQIVRPAQTPATPAVAALAETATEPAERPSEPAARSPSRPAANALLDAAELARRLTSGSAHSVLPGIDFAGATANLLPSARAQVAELARLLAEQPQLRLYVVAHTAKNGDLQRSLELSRRRARAISDMLVREYGVVGERLVPEGLGFLAPPLDVGAPPRRVEILAQ